MPLLVNGELIDETAIREERKRIRERLEQELPDETAPEIESKAREWALDNVIERALLRQAAWGFTEAQTPPDEEADTDWRLAAFTDHLTKNVPRPQRREVSDYYRKNQVLFLTPECVHASHIHESGDDRAVIEAAEAELRAGKPFAEVAERYSGGDLGWLGRGEMVAELEAVVFALRPNQVSPIFRSPLGFHIAKLHARKAAGVLPLRDVYNLAEELMLKRRRDEAIERFLDEIRAKSDIRRVPSLPTDP